MAASRQSYRNMLWWSLGLTFIIELVTIVLRFGLQMESTRDTASTIGRLTFGIRIHHGYCGLALMLVAYCLMSRYPRLARWGLIIGLALLLSDLIHHFLVLWPITGSPHFDLTYPPL
jgi:hypothetical protein